MQAFASYEKTPVDGSDIAATSVRVLWPGDEMSMVIARRIVAWRFLQGGERRFGMVVSARSSVAKHTGLTDGWRGLSRLFGSCAARSKLQNDYLAKKLSPHFHFVLLISLRPNPKEMWSYNVQ